MGATDAIERLEQRIASNPDDARAHYQVGVLLLATRDLYAFYSPDKARVLPRAERHLQRAVELDGKNAAAHAALGFTLHQRGKRLPDALAAFKTARRLNPRDETVDVYVPTILVEMEREKEALAEIARVGRRRKAPLASLRKQIREAGWEIDAETLLSSGFIRARNYMWSRLSDEAERIRNSVDRGRKQRLANAEFAECSAQQRELAKEFRVSRVPGNLRPLSVDAKRYGVGDDTCRPLLMKRMPKAERVKLIRRADALAGEVDEWLNTFPAGKMTAEAAAFMYLMSGVDEIR